MAAPAVLKVNIVSDFDRKGVDKGTAAFKQIGRSAQIAATALGGVLVAGGAKAIQAAEKGGTANSRLANILEQTAKASDSTVKSVQDQASALASLTGIDDDVIKGGQAILGTFKSVATDAGKLDGVFNRATTASADLAAAGFGSVESNATALGKALENPTKGLTALTRSGVTFTKAEQKKIKALQESGKLQEAQGIILSAIEGQVGGTAEATANATDKIAEAFDETAESLGNALLPYLDQATTAFQDMATWVQENVDTVKKVVAGIAGFVAIVATATVALKVYQAAVVVYNAIVKTITLVTKGWAIAQKILNAAMRANPIGIIVTIIIALVVAVVAAYKKNEKFRNVVQKVWAAVKRAIAAVVNFFKRAWTAAVNVATRVINKAKSVFTRVLNAIKSIARTVSNAFKTVWTSAVNRVKTIFQSIKTKVSTIFNAIKRVFTTVATAFKTAFNNAATRIKSIFNGVKTKISNIMNSIKNAIETAVNFGKGLINTLIGKVNAAIDLINKVPGINIPKVPTVKTSTRSGTSVVTRVATTNASRFAATRANVATSGGTPTIIINGAIDPDATARQIRRILSNHDRRVGTAYLGGAV